jgi:hypothetical protein
MPDIKTKKKEFKGVCECGHASCYHRIFTVLNMFGSKNACNMDDCKCLRFTRIGNDE